MDRNGWPVCVGIRKVVLTKPGDEIEASLIDELLGTEDEKEDEALAQAEEITFGLEKDLQSALRTNIGQLESGLKIVDGGKERVTEAGRIDITASDSKERTVVIELKAGTATPDVIAQVLSYMTVVSEMDHKDVRGIVVAGDFQKRVRLAARSIPNLELKKYSFKFSFDSIE